MQGLKEVAMHEVGHTLGLRHNFKASTMLALEDINDPEKTKDTGLAGSVMDYTPVNIVPKGVTQGDYFSTTIGPYDMWAIEYGYKPLSGGTEGEVAELKKIAARSGEPGLAYATDEDTRGIDPDPLVEPFRPGQRPGRVRQDCEPSWSPSCGPTSSSESTEDGRRLSAGAAGVRRAAWASTAGRCTSPRGTSAACTSAAATRATRTAGRRSSIVPSRQAARGAGAARRAGLQRQAVPVPAGVVQPPGRVALGPLGHVDAVPRSTIRCTT